MSRLLAATGTLAVVAATVIVSAAPASAVDGLASVEYVSGIPASVIGDPGAEFAAGWNAYNESDEEFTEYVSTVSGLSADAGMLFMKGVAPTTDFVAAEDGAVLSSGPDAVIVLAVQASAPGGAAIPVVRLPLDDGTFVWASFETDETGTLAEVVAGLEADSEQPATLVAYGFSTSFFEAEGAEVVVTTTYLTWGGLTSMFTPQPVATVPASVLLSAARTGVVFSSTGFLPGESVEVYLGGGNAGGLVGTAVADAAGVVAYTLAVPEAVVGDYRLTLAGSLPNFQYFDFAVVADPVAIVPARLAATGADLSAGFAAGGFLLLAGAGLAVLASRRRSRA